MLVFMIFSERKKVFREGKKCEKIRAKRLRSLFCLFVGKVVSGVGDEEVVVIEGVVVKSSSLEMLTNSCLGGIMVSLIFLEGLEGEALEEFMVELFKKEDKMNEMMSSGEGGLVLYGPSEGTPYANSSSDHRSVKAYASSQELKYEARTNLFTYFKETLKLDKAEQRANIV
nr:hypothetical protein [Tanacetum cinerariifolium]